MCLFCRKGATINEEQVHRNDFNKNDTPSFTSMDISTEQELHSSTPSSSQLQTNIALQTQIILLFPNESSGDS